MGWVTLHCNFYNFVDIIMTLRPHCIHQFDGSQQFGGETHRAPVLVNEGEAALKFSNYPCESDCSTRSRLPSSGKDVTIKVLLHAAQLEIILCPYLRNWVPVKIIMTQEGRMEKVSWKEGRKKGRKPAGTNPRRIDCVHLRRKSQRSQRISRVRGVRGTITTKPNAADSRTTTATTTTTIWTLAC